MYIDCCNGIAGDMFVGALLDLGIGSAGLLDAELSRLGLEGWSLSCKKVNIGGVSATRFSVAVEEDSGGAAGMVSGGGGAGVGADGSGVRGFREIEDIIGSSGLPDRVREDAATIYRRLGEAEAGAHGCSLGEVHFHELGMVDSILDVMAACVLMGELEPEEVICSPVATGYGSVETMHGVMPVPAPATERLLEGIPAFKGEVAGELATPTGVALVSYFASGFGSLPSLRMASEGYGAGGKEIEGGGVLRMVMGEY